MIRERIRKEIFFETVCEKRFQAMLSSCTDYLAHPFEKSHQKNEKRETKPSFFERMCQVASTGLVSASLALDSNFSACSCWEQDPRRRGTRSRVAACSQQQMRVIIRILCLLFADKREENETPLLLSNNRRLPALSHASSSLFHPVQSTCLTFAKRRSNPCLR